MGNIKVLIEGEKAKLDAQTLLSIFNGNGKLVENKATEQKQTVRAVDWASTVEIFNVAKDLVSMGGTLVSTAYIIWKWRKELGEYKDVTLKKEKEGRTFELTIYVNTTEKEIENFVNQSDSSIEKS